MTPQAWEFISSGAGDEHTVRWNEEAYVRLRLRQRALEDVSRLDTRVRLLGREWPHPILLAPTSNHTLVHPDGEVATARGAGAAGATMVVSSFADKPLEEIARAATATALARYLYHERPRAHSATCSGAPWQSDARRFASRSIRQWSAPGTASTGRTGSLANRSRFWTTPRITGAIPTTWKDIDWVRSQTKLPLVLKGILDPDDADRGIRAGAAAIYVSNHGGRNLDTLPATIEVLAEIADKVSGRVPIIVDGGVRRGTDVIKALALGATAVAIGRPYLYGLAVSGAEVSAVWSTSCATNWRWSMALTGRPTISTIDRSLILPPAGFPKA